VTPTAIRTVAVLSDIHGVAPALDAVLTEPDVAAAERIVVTGDIAAGPHPVDVLDRLVDLGERVVWVRGNADRELVTLARGGTTIIPDPIGPWAAQQLPDRHVALLADLPHPVTLQLDGFGAVLFCHGTPRDAQLRTTLFDVEAACAGIVATGCPEAEAWADFFVRSPAGDAQALSTFAPRDGRDADVVPR